MTPLLFEQAGVEPEPVLAGSVDEVRFAAPLSSRLDGAGLYVFELGSDDSNTRGDLVLRWQVFRPDRSARDSPTTDPVVLLRDISVARFAYFGRLGEEIDADWHTEWHGGKTLPELIRIDVQFRESDARRWPTFVVAPKLNDGLEP
jgi:hypothetical protein